MNSEFLPAVADAINETVEECRSKLQAAILEVFDSPTSYTVHSVGVRRAVVRQNGKGPAGMVFIYDGQAAYLNLEIVGGERRAGDYATTRLGPLVPGPAAPRDANGNLPRGFVEHAMKDPSVRWVTLRPGAPPVLVRSLPGVPGGSGRNGGARRRLQILALAVRRTTKPG